MSFLSPVAYSDYGFPSVGWGSTVGYGLWTMPQQSMFQVNSPWSMVHRPFYSGSFYGSLFSPTYGGIPFMPSYDSYNFDVMNAGAILSTWGNVVEGDPFYRFYNPWSFGSYVPWLPFYPSTNLFSDHSAPAAPAAAQTAQAPQSHEGPQVSQHERDIQREEPDPRLLELNEQLKQLRAEEEARKNGGGTADDGTQTNGHGAKKSGRSGEMDPAKIKRKKT